MTATFAALACAILAVPVHWPARLRHAPPLWCSLFAVACVLGVVESVIDWRGLLALVALALLLYRAGRQTKPFSLYHALAALLALSLGAHRVPGFHNPILID